MRRTTVIRISVLAVMAAAIGAAALFLPVRDYLATFLDWLQDAGPVGMILLGALYVPLSLFLPATPLTLAAGFVFGVVRGTIVVSTASVLSASLAFWAGRTLARGLIEDRVSRNPKFAAIDQAVGEHGFKIVLLTRLSPVFPFILLNYAFGLTKVSFRDYVIASWIGMLPGTIMYVYLGSAAKSLTDLLAGRIETGPTQKAMFIAGLIATVLVTVLVARIAKRSLGRAIAGAAPAAPNAEERPPDTP